MFLIVLLVIISILFTILLKSGIFNRDMLFTFGIMFLLMLLYSCGRFYETYGFTTVFP
jgi:hypothetical protein